MEAKVVPRLAFAPAAGRRVIAHDPSWAARHTMKARNVLCISSEKESMCVVDKDCKVVMFWLDPCQSGNSILNSVDMRAIHVCETVHSTVIQSRS